MQGEQESMRGRMQKARGSIFQARGQADQWLGDARGAWGDVLSRFQGTRWGGFSGGMVAFMLAAGATTLLLFSGVWNRAEVHRQRSTFERLGLWWNTTLASLGWRR